MKPTTSPGKRDEYDYQVTVLMNGQAYWVSHVRAVSPETAACRAFADALIFVLNNMLPPGPPDPPPVVAPEGAVQLRLMPGEDDKTVADV